MGAGGVEINTVVRLELGLGEGGEGGRGGKCGEG